MLVSDVDHVVAGEGAALAEDSFGTAVVLIGLKLKFVALGAVAGERAGGLLDVVLGVVALAEHEEFEEFAGEVFVGGVLFAILEV